MAEIPIDSWEMTLFDAKKAQSDFYKKATGLEKFSPSLSNILKTKSAGIIGITCWHTRLLKEILIPLLLR
jgi:hypothetical protein